jgi:ERF superfamily
MQMSEKIDLLATALSKAQGEITGAKKDSDNPFFKSKYADLAACWDACREAVSANGLSVIQTTARGEPVTIQWETMDKESGEVSQFKVDTVELVILTTLMHTSGQWISSPLPMIPRDATPQGIGSAITYGRRYGLCGMLGVAQVDDDGNQASGRPGKVHEIKGNLGQNVAPSKAQATASHMLKLMNEDIIGDHEGLKKAMIILDYHEKVLNPDENLYVAVGEVLTPAKRNAWKAFVSQAKQAEKADRDMEAMRR